MLVHEGLDQRQAVPGSDLPVRAQGRTINPCRCEARWGTRTQGRTQNRVLFARRQSPAMRCSRDQPSQESRLATFSAAEDQTAQASTLPSRPRTR